MSKNLSLSTVIAWSELETYIVTDFVLSRSVPKNCVKVIFPPTVSFSAAKAVIPIEQRSVRVSIKLIIFFHIKSLLYGIVI